MAKITEIRTLIAAGWSYRKIARETGHDRGTIKKYAQSQETGENDNGGDCDSKPAKVIAGNGTERSACEPFRDLIEEMLEKNLTADRVFRDLRVEHKFPHSYSSVSRFVRKLKARDPKRVWRMECEPGEEAQVDFGVARTLRGEDGKLRYGNVLRVSLSFSRKGYTETVPYQDTECFLRGLENAFREFGGVPATVRIDNLKAAVKKADWYDPELNPKIVDFARHYRIAIIPTRPYMPQHKGKVESDVGYVKRSALKGREFNSIAEQNAHLQHWESNVADLRIHGTTRKQVGTYFNEQEKPFLRELPLDLFPCYQEGSRKVHRDSYVEVRRAYYHVPPEYINRTVWVRWDSKMVHVFEQNMTPIIKHVRLEPGKFSQCLAARGRRKDCKAHSSQHWINKSALIGPFAGKWAQTVARNRPEHCIRVLQGLKSLTKGDKHSRADINRACELSLAGGNHTLGNVKANLAMIESNPGAVPRQEQLPMLIEEHPVIRPLSEYQDIVEATDSNPNQQKEKHI